MLTVCVLFIVLVITGTAVDVLLWFTTDVFPNLFLTETELSVTATDLKFCEVKKSINNDKPAGNEDEPLINTKSKLKANQSMAETRCIEFLKDLILSFSLYKTVPVIMNTHQPANAITSINGIRVISMLACLQLGINQSDWLEYLKMVFLKILNIPLRRVFSIQSYM